MDNAPADTGFSFDRLQQLEDFFVNAPVGLQITDQHTRIGSANLAQLSLLGHLDDRSAYEGHEFTEFFEDQALVSALRKSLADGRTENNVEARVRTGSGAYLDVVVDVSPKVEGATLVGARWFTRPLKTASMPSIEPSSLSVELPDLPLAPDAEGAVDAHHDTAQWGASLVHDDRDSALLLLTEDEQHRRYDELNDFFENAPAGVHFVGFNGLIMRANKAELSLLGYLDQPSEYVGHHVRRIHYDKALVEDLLSRLVEGKPIINFPAKLYKRDRSVQPVIIYSGLRLKDGRFENTRCFLFENCAPEGSERDAGETETSVFSWPRNEE